MASLGVTETWFPGTLQRRTTDGVLGAARSQDMREIIGAYRPSCTKFVAREQTNAWEPVSEGDEHLFDQLANAVSGRIDAQSLR
jgi:hypothetical protein